jgi:hypothetical protein
MNLEATPFRWPASWTDPARVDLLKGTPANMILVPPDAAFERVRARAKDAGIAAAAGPPTGTVIVEGAWPGVKSTRAGGNQESGPTGVPWVDSNGWLVRLTRTQHPGATVWVEAPPKDRRVFPPASYELAVADVAAHGARWILSLDPALASQVTADTPAWKRMMAAAAYFAGRATWADYTAAAVLGVISDYAGGNEFMSQELLNLLARAGMNYRIVPKAKPDFAGLRALLYADKEAPAPALRKQAMAFVEAGGLLIAAPVWGAPGGKAAPAEHPRYAMSAVGKGRVAMALAEPDDPWQLANDSVVLVSHRHDLVRCFNSGSFGSYYTHSPDRQKALVHLLFYSDRGPGEASVRVAGKYRAARISTVDQPEPKNVPAEFGKDSVEVHLPPVPPYVALELSV